MIKRKEKICKRCGKPRVIFGHGLCWNCYRLEQATKQANKTPNNSPERAYNQLSLKSKGNIPHRTSKRLKQEEQYSRIVKEMDKEKKIYCVFCGEGMKRPEDHHHLLGRDGDLLTDKRYIKHAHHDCHMDYHNKSVTQLPWFNDYVNRVSDIDTLLAEREMNKFNKQ